MELNPSQRAGVEHRGSPLLLLAGAGTGKTRVITHRVAALIDEGVPAWRILAVTFTNKAASEMRERIAELLGMDLAQMRRDGPWIGTFHSICARILRRHGERVGLSRNFAIYDADDQKSMMRRVLKDLNIDAKYFSASAALGKLDKAKNRGLGRAQLDQLQLGQPLHKWTSQAWELYERRLRAADAADFGDLLVLAVELLRSATPQAPREGSQLDGGGPDPVIGLRRRFHQVVVDEYQDTNPVQAELVDLLANRAELVVVGDDDQAIYGWRGADHRQILAFPDRHPGCELIRLEQNYRSTTHILDCANAVIQHGSSRFDKALWSDLGEGEPVELRAFPDERSEARWVAQSLRTAIDDGVEPSQLAVFYRTHAQSRPLEEALRMQSVRYKMLGGIRFYDRREIKDLVAYLRLMTNPGSDLDCRRIINVPPRRIGAKTIEKLAKLAHMNESSFFEATSDPLTAGLGKASARAVRGFYDLVIHLREQTADLPHHQAALLVLEQTKYRETLGNEEDAEVRLENLQEFLGALEQFVAEQPEATLAEYLESISLGSDTDEDGRRIDSVVNLMTVHAAKGLEFERVMITGLEERVFPHARSLKDDAGRDELEEERRLAYVALTRAKRRLSLSFVARRFLWGSTHVNPPSRFLEELPRTSTAVVGRTPQRRRRQQPKPVTRRENSWDDDIVLDPQYAAQSAPRSSPAQADLPPAEQPDAFQDVDYEPESVSVYVGMPVRHRKFGLGSVIAWSGSGDALKLVIRFSGGLSKTILARFCEPLGG